MPLVLGVDSSTQSTKAELRHLDTGELVATGRAPHPPTDPPVSEQDPRAWWAALVDAVGALGPTRADVVGISVAAQQHGLVLLDRAGEPVRPAKLWNDTTSSAVAAELVDRLGAEAWTDACGSVPVASFTITKLALLAREEPQSLAATDAVALPHDHLTRCLTGHHVTDRGDASGTGWYDPAAGRYRPDLLALAVDDADAWLARLPRVLGPIESAGALTADAATALGLPAGVPVGPGTGDNMAAALGLGLATGDVVISLGTSGTAYAVSDQPARDVTGHVAGFADASGRHLPLVCTLNATRVTDTVAAWLGLDRDRFAELALEAPLAPGPVLLPYFDGERTPNLPDAAGALVGLRTSTGPSDLARAAHVGVLSALFDGVDALVAAGIEPSGRLLLVGGGARSDAYRRLAADLWGAPVVVPDTDETVATGACVQAAAVAGGGTLADIAERWALGRGARIDPRDAEAGRAARAAYTEAAATLGPLI